VIAEHFTALKGESKEEAMKKNKMLILLMVCVLVLSAFSGCGGTKDDGSTASASSSSTAGTDGSSDAGSGSDAAATGSDLQKIKDAGKMIIGITDYEPMNYYDESGELIGFDTEYTKLVCEQLGVTPEFIEINWANKEIELDAGNVDCLWNGVTYNEERAKTMSFSTPYVNNDIVVVVRKADVEKYKTKADLLTAAIVAEGGSSADEDVTKDEELAGANFTPVDSLVSSLMEVAAGTADAAVVDSTMANALVGKEAYADLVIVPEIEFPPELLAIAFRLGSDLTPEVDKITKSLIGDGTLAALAEKYGINLKAD
jgi:polar amino acid transport system substrate-binding protein